MPYSQILAAARDIHAEYRDHPRWPAIGVIELREATAAETSTCIAALRTADRTNHA